MCLFWFGGEGLSFIGELNTLYLPSLRIGDIVEIIILIYAIYKIIVGLRNTRAMILLKGILVLFIVYNVAYLFKFEAILIIFQSIITLLLFAVIIIFQPEMRRFLEQIGTKNLTGKFNLKSLFTKEKEVFKYYSDKAISELGKACFAMGDVKTGALIVIERDIPLTEYIETGIPVNADLSSQLLINIFEKNTPLHDGAVIQIKDKIIAATCYLPLSENTHIGKHMGTRHRAAIGISEVTDCIVIVVSEETGSVSVAMDGKIQYNMTKEELTSILYKNQVRKESIESSVIKNKMSLKHLLRKENLSTRIVSIFVGIVSWFLLINMSDPIITETFEDIPIEYVQTSVIESLGSTFTVLSGDTVDVKVTERRSIVDSLVKSDITVIADFSKLSYVKSVPLSGFIEKYPGATVEFVDENSIQVELDAIISKEIDITLDKQISKDSSTFVPVLNSDDKTIIVTGGESIINTIDKVVFSYDVSNAIDTYTGVSAPIVYDKNGVILDNDLFEFNIEGLSVWGEAYPIKEIPLIVGVLENSINGYSISSVDYDPKTVKIAGNAQYIASIHELSIQMNLNLNPDSLSNNQLVRTLKITDNLPEGVYFADETDELKVTLTFEEYSTKSITFTKEDIELRGLNDEEYTAELKDNLFTIQISGEDKVLNEITSESVVPFIDVSALEEGEYNLILQFEGLGDVILTSNISARLTIRKD